jgi:hypothetical protein
MRLAIVLLIMVRDAESMLRYQKALACGLGQLAAALGKHRTTSKTMLKPSRHPAPRHQNCINCSQKFDEGESSRQDLKLNQISIDLVNKGACTFIYRF